MHKDVDVATLEMDEDYGLISRVVKVHDYQHMPIGTVIKGTADGRSIKDWWASRSIPASRSGLRDFLESLGLYDVRTLLTKSMGLSLSDQYWIRPAEKEIRWRDVNFFDNEFSDDIGDMLFGRKISGEIDLVSPDNTSDGVLKKRWKILDGRRCLIKGSTGTIRQEPFNEVIASKIMSALDVPHVDYEILWIDDRPYSICKDFITRDTELISAYRIMTSQKMRNDHSLYQHYVDCCQRNGIEVVPFLDQMLVIDYIIGNTDRHTNNFGLIRDANTLEWIGPAPIFDSGSSLGCDLRTDEIMNQAGIHSKPFKDRHSNQIKLVSSFDWIDFDALEKAIPEIERIMSSSNGGIDDDRRTALMLFIESRIADLRWMSEGRQPVRRPRSLSSPRAWYAIPQTSIILWTRFLSSSSCTASLRVILT